MPKGGVAPIFKLGSTWGRGHLRFFNWHIIKTLTNVQLFWMIKCTRGWMKCSFVCNYFFN
jgi:hypothetical protein